MTKLFTKLSLTITSIPNKIIMLLLITIYCIILAFNNYSENSVFMPFQIVECAESNNSNSEIAKEVIKELQKQGVTVNHRFENQDTIKTTSEIAKEGFRYLIPGVTITGVGIATSKILNVFPPEARVSAFFGVFGAVGGFTLLSQYINRINNTNQASTVVSSSSNLSNPLTVSNSINNSPILSSDTEHTAPSGGFQETTAPSGDFQESESSRFDINSPFELGIDFENIQQGLSIVMIFFSIGMLYPYLSLTINLLVNEFNLKDNPYINKYPKLVKILLYFEKSSRFYRFLMLFLIGINLIGMIITVYYLNINLITN